MSSSQQKTLEQRLNAYPVIKQRIRALLNLVENIDGDVEKANDAERKLIEELRQFGNDALHCWADKQHEKQVSTALDKGENLKKSPQKINLVHNLWLNNNSRNNLI